MEVNSGITLVATRVVDLPPEVAEVSDSGGVADRAYWEQRSSSDSMKIVDGLLDMIRKVAPEVSPNYRKSYITLEYGGKVWKFVQFHPNKNNTVRTEFALSQDSELTKRIEESDLSFAHYKYRGYWLRVRHSDLDHHSEVLSELIERAHAEVGG